MAETKEFIFLLGAGASVPVEIPDMKSFKKEFVESCKNDQTLQKTLKVLLEYNRYQDLENLLINLYSLTHLGESIEAKVILDDLKISLPEYLKSPEKLSFSIPTKLVNHAVSKLKATASRLTSRFETLENTLLDFINKRCLSFDLDKAKKIYTPLIDLSQESKLHIFTTNYDPLIEEICRSNEQTRDKYFDGFILDKTIRSEVWDYNLAGFGQSIINIYKLHGSATWYRNKDSTKIIQLQAKIGSGAEFKDGSKMFHHLIYPASIKDIYSYPFFNLYMFFLDAIRQNDLCIAIGHSLRDIYVYSAVFDRLRDENFHLVFISPENKNKALQALLSKPNVIYCPFKIEKFIEPLKKFCIDYMSNKQVALAELQKNANEEIKRKRNFKEKLRKSKQKENTPVDADQNK